MKRRRYDRSWAKAEKFLSSAKKILGQEETCVLLLKNQNVKPQPRQAKLTERKVETFTAPQNIEHDTQEPSKTTATSIITTTKKEEYRDQGHDFKDLYEESNLMTEDKRDFENNPLGNNRSNDKKGTAIAFSSAPPAEILSNTQTESIPLSSPRYEIERVSVAKSMSLDTYATTRTQQQKSYPADLRFATSRTTSSFAANKLLRYCTYSP